VQQDLRKREEAKVEKARKAKRSDIEFINVFNSPIIIFALKL
jgi:hypothetical protein